MKFMDSDITNGLMEDNTLEIGTRTSRVVSASLNGQTLAYTKATSKKTTSMAMAFTYTRTKASTLAPGLIISSMDLVYTSQVMESETLAAGEMENHQRLSSQTQLLLCNLARSTHATTYKRQKKILKSCNNTRLNCFKRTETLKKLVGSMPRSWYTTTLS